VHKALESKNGTYYYELHNGSVIESDKKLELMQDEEGSYIAKESWGEGKMIIVLVSTVFFAAALMSVFIEELEIKKAVKRAILKDARPVPILAARRAPTGMYTRHTARRFIKASARSALTTRKSWR